MPWRLFILAILLTAAGGSFWLLDRFGGGVNITPENREPDYYLENFTTVTMDDDGIPKHKLSAAYMAHYPDDDSSELRQPKMEIFRDGKQPLYLEANEGRISGDKNTVSLQGAVRMWEPDTEGGHALRVETSEATILLKEEYAETDKRTIITTSDSVIIGTGMRAYLPENRLEVIQHEKTTIKTGQGS